MQSLYDALHVPNPDAPAEKVEPWPEHLTGKQFAELVVTSQEFRKYILLGIATGDLPPAVITRLMDHAWGSPVKQLEVKDVTPAQEMTVEQLETRIEHLRAAAHRLRQEEQAPNNSASKSIH
jgi:hypothetical protein